MEMLGCNTHTHTHTHTHTRKKEGQGVLKLKGSLKDKERLGRRVCAFMTSFFPWKITAF
jgi:hypothetical protein